MQEAPDEIRNEKDSICASFVFERLTACVPSDLSASVSIWVSLVGVGLNFQLSSSQYLDWPSLSVVDLSTVGYVKGS